MNEITTTIYAPCEPTPDMVAAVHELTQLLRTENLTYRVLQAFDLQQPLIMPGWVHERPERGIVTTDDASRLIYEVMIQHHCSEEFS